LHSYGALILKAIVENEPGPAGGTLLLDAALESIPFGFCVWSSDFRLVMWNQHYLDIYGFPSRRI
jgi:PAS domain-containing protein